MQFHCSLFLPKQCPWEERQTEIDNRRIQGIYSLFQLNSKVFIGVKLSCFTNKNLCKVGIHTPITYLICMSQGVARNLATNAHVVHFLMGCTKARLNITQTFPIRELCKSHAEKLLPTGKVLDFVVAIVLFNTLIEFIRWYKVHELRKYCLSRIHTPSPSALVRKYGFYENSISNRKILKCLVKLVLLPCYTFLLNQRWDSSDPTYSF